MKYMIKMYDDIIESDNDLLENDEISPMEAGFMKGAKNAERYPEEEDILY